MADHDSMCLRILSDIERLIEMTDFLKHFSIIPEADGGTNVKNENPVQVGERTLALKAWCVKHIYSYAYKELLRLRPLLKKNRATTNDMFYINKLLIGVLLIQPDVNTFWNMKRELVDHGIIDILEELKFTTIVLSHKNKSNESFSYRRWCINKLLKSGKVSPMNPEGPVSASTLFSQECEVTSEAAKGAQNNYHAWNHRIWTMQTFLRHINELTCNVIMFERNYSLDFTTKHVSEHAGYHYRQYVLKLVKEFDFERGFFDDHFSNITSKLPKNGAIAPEEILGTSFYSSRYPFVIRTKYVNFLSIMLIELLYTLEHYFSFYEARHESIWYHRRFVIYQLLETYSEFHGLTLVNNNNLNDNFHCYGRNITGTDIQISTKRSEVTGEHYPKLFKSDHSDFKNSYLYEIMVKSERKIIERNTTGKCCEQQRDLAKRHEKWLKYVMHFPLDI